MNKDEAKQTWAFADSDKSEQWCGPFSKQDAIDECIGVYESGYIAPCVQPEIPELPAYFLIESIYDAMQDSDYAIEQSTDWLSKVEDKHQDLLENWVNEAIEKWFDLHPQYKPSWFLVDYQKAERVGDLK